MTLLSAVIVLLIIVTVGYAAFWFIGKGFPADTQGFARFVVAVVGLIALAYVFVPALHV